MPWVNGKEVIFKERFPARENWDLPRLLASLAANASEMNMERAVPILQRMIASWEFDSDPAKAESYGDLCIFREITPLVKACSEFVGEMVSGPGEAGSAPT